MKNIPRIFIGDNVKSGMTILAEKSVAHYLGHVMRTHDFLGFGGGYEFSAHLSDDGKSIIIGDMTKHPDPSNDITLYFAPIKRTDDLVNMATQMGVARIVPVITDHTIAHHINWERVKKIATEASEQSNRNSVPEISAPIKFSELDLRNLCFADERFACSDKPVKDYGNLRNILIGPEGGFSESEFATLDASSAVPVSLGKTILRAELAAAIAIGKLLK